MSSKRTAAPSTSLSITSFDETRASMTASQMNSVRVSELHRFESSECGAQRFNVEGSSELEMKRGADVRVHVRLNRRRR